MEREDSPQVGAGFHGSRSYFCLWVLGHVSSSPLGSHFPHLQLEA